MRERARRGDQRFRASKPVPRHSPGPTPPARPARRPPLPALPASAQCDGVVASGLGPRHCWLSGLRARRAGPRPPAASARDRPSHRSPPHSPQSPACTSVASCSTLCTEPLDRGTAGRRRVSSAHLGVPHCVLVPAARASKQFCSLALFRPVQAFLIFKFLVRLNYGRIMCLCLSRQRWPLRLAGWLPSAGHRRAGRRIRATLAELPGG